MNNKYARNKNRVEPAVYVWCPMRIASWNVWDENPKSGAEIAEFIRVQDADVVCLQEVAAPLLETLVPSLHAAYPHYYVAKDAQYAEKDLRALGFFSRIFEGIVYRLSDAYAYYIVKDAQPVKKYSRSLVFFSRLPVVRARAIRTRARRGWRSFFAAWTRIEEHLEFQRVDVKTRGGVVRIMNAHLEIGAGACNRLRQFKYVLRRCKRRGRIKRALMVGDFNIFGEELYPRFVGWLGLGSGSKWLWLNERDEFEKICKKRGLKNIFKGQPTFFKGGAQFQLDHILVPEKMTILSQKVLEDAYGSDHQFVLTDVNI